MKNNDFSVPRRMSKSAYVVLLCKECWSYSGVFLILSYLELRDSGSHSFIDLLGEFMLMVVGMLLVIALIAFFNYYFKTYYVSEGNLVFKHGVLRRETTMIPLHKIHSMRTKRGFIYQLLDMTGVSFDTLASKDAEIELILDDKDWQALLKQVETQEMMSEAPKGEEAVDSDELPPVPDTSAPVQMRYSNLNLLKGAFCQNHFKGMAILGGVLATIYGKLTAVSDEAIGYAIDYVADYADHADYITHSVTMIVLLIVGAYLVTMLLWMGKAFLDYYHTVVRTDKSRLFFEHGLITRRSAQFSYDKVCTVMVKQNFMEKWLNGRTIQLKQAFNIMSGDEQNKTGNDVKIYGAPSSSNILQWWLGKDYQTADVLGEARSGWGVFGYTVKNDVLMVLVAAGLLAYFEQYLWVAVPLVYLLFSLVKGFLAVRKSRITLKDDYMIISNGRFAQVLNYIKYENIESVKMVSTPLTPIYHRVSLRVYTNGSAFVVRSLKKDEASRIYELLLCWCRGK